MRYISRMSTLQQIDRWLNSSRDVAQGRQLLNSLDRYVNAVTLNVVNRFTNSGTAVLITKELELVKKKIQASARPKPKTTHLTWKDIDYTGLTPDLKKLYKEVKEMYQLLDTQRGKSKATPEGDDLRELALEIVSIRKQIMLALDKLFYFQKYKVELDPGITEVSENDQIKKLTGWLRALKSHPPYISKNKNNPDPRVQQEVIARRRELKEINEYLNATEQ